MRDAFFDKLYEIAKINKQVILLTDDFGAPSLDKFRKDLSSQHINIGIAEQNMVSIAAGLALGGKIVYIYAIAPFVTLRCCEQIKVDLCCMNLHVTALGVGAGYSYSDAGPTHHATEDIAIMRALPGMTILNPSDNVMAAACAEISFNNPGPKYIRFDREKFPLIYNPTQDFSDGLTYLKTGNDLTLIATGKMVHQAFKVADELAKHSVDTGIVDLYRIKPVNEKLLLKIIEKSERVVTLEENFINGGIGSILAEVLADNNKTLPLKRIAIPDQYYFRYGNRNSLLSFCGLDVNSVTKRILKWLG
ncbi:1-deoxy-D-xylulose-5-phosphate synthase [Patescibacteria group bacterium]|nr:1-deoxy-D-xylulose-5-phosphate synthase [Patescibacteria group bacterium]MBU0846461.1 1-deoxy-D-xylulose-5-phosphate synthase [Patescibacteria group bacterium]